MWAAGVVLATSSVQVDSAHPHTRLEMITVPVLHHMQVKQDTTSHDHACKKTEDSINCHRQASSFSGLSCFQLLTTCWYSKMGGREGLGTMIHVSQTMLGIT